MKVMKASVTYCAHTIPGPAAATSRIVIHNCGSHLGRGTLGFPPINIRP